jgi:predicted secreted hydrolase
MKALLPSLLPIATALALTATAQEFRPPATTPDGFLVPQPGRVFRFPQDHGRHDGFKIEWWYVTGHLTSEDGRPFGFQLTFFRNAGPTPIVAPASAFAHAPLHLGHFAVLDARTGRFLHQSRINREGWDASASPETLSVRNGSWRLERTPSPEGPETFTLRGGVRGEATLRLTLTALKPLVTFGSGGVSRKGADPTASSHYLTFPRLQASGTLDLAGVESKVTGSAWMDHEFSSSQLEPGQSGWDWACLQFDDGTEAMAYRMRRDNGSTDPFSTFAWIGTNAVPRHLGPDRFTWEPTGHWTSPLTGARYPNHVRLTAPDPVSGQVRVLELEPLAEAQEIADPLGGVAYWEGACRIRDPQGRILGKAYLELTGYIGSLREKFR